MTTVSATYARENFAEIIDAAQREPVRIKRHDRELAVLISAEEYEQLRAMRVQEAIRLTEVTSRFAASQGLTGERLEELLASRG